MLWLAAGIAVAGLDVALVDLAPKPGDAVRVRLSWTNDGADPVEVPSFLLGRGASISVERKLPGEPDSVVEREPPSGSLDAEQVKWVALAPGAAATRTVALSELTEECVAGCRGGAYVIDVELAYPQITGRSAGQRLPRDRATLRFEVRQDAVDATSDLALVPVRATRTGPTAIEVVTRLENRGTTTILVPSSPVERCELRYLLAGATRTAGSGEAPSPLERWTTEATSQPLVPGTSRELSTTCGMVPREAEQVEARIVLAPNRPFFQEEPGPQPRVHAGEVASAWTAAR
jgi:hypothetical protein